MVAVIEGQEEAYGARFIEFKVHRSETDPDRIVGSWRLTYGESSLIDQSRALVFVLARFLCPNRYTLRSKTL